MKISFLYLDITINEGKNERRPASEAPIPTVTNVMGKAQHITVLKLANKVMKDTTNSFNI